MGKTYINAVKYEITATFKIDGIVDKHDIIGAIFGQSEGLLGDDLDLRELQKNGKIGRITISLLAHGGNTTGKVVVPSSMDMVETSILAAAIETVDKVGPCKASLVVREIEDTRSKKREDVVNRAQDLLERLMRDQIPESEQIAKQVRESVRTSGIQSYGRDKLPCGPAVNTSDSLIVVEGRADVLTLLKNNIKNVIGMDGSKISDTVVDLGRKKGLTLFVDGDRGGELILRKLASLTNVEFVARAPDGKEVEELSRKEIIMALRKKVPLSDATGRKPEARRPVERERAPMRGVRTVRAPGKDFGRKPSFSRGRRFERRTVSRVPARSGFEAERPKPPSKEELEEIGKLRPVMESLKGTLKAKIFDAKMKELEEVSVRDLLKTMKKHKDAKTIVLDGIITKRLLEAAEAGGIATLAGAKAGKIEKSEKTKAVVIN